MTDRFDELARRFHLEAGAAQQARERAARQQDPLAKDAEALQEHLRRMGVACSYGEARAMIEERKAQNDQG